MTDKERADSLNQARQTLLATLAGIVATAGLAFTARTFYLSRRGQLTDRYATAIAQLAGEKVEERLGGLYALEHLMRESSRDHDTIVEVLASFVREHTETADMAQGLHPHVERTDDDQGGLTIDVQAALTVLGRRPRRRENSPVNLTGAVLNGADLKGAWLPGAILFGSHLRRAKLDGANLRGANLNKAELCRAHIRNARLRSARLVGVNLQDAVLCGADLRKANLALANMQGASLGCTWKGIRLNNQYGPDGGCQLMGARNLTTEQLRLADIDETTALDPALRRDLIE